MKQVDDPIRCHACGQTYTVRHLLAAAYRCLPGLYVTQCHTPCCAKTEELFLCDDQISRGYLYAAGAPHFAAMEEYAAPGLAVKYGPGDLFITWNEWTHNVPIE